MRTSFLLPWAVLLSHLPTFAEPDPRAAEALHRLSSEASKLWETAPAFIALETLSQRAIAPGRRKPHAPEVHTREIVSLYALGAFKGSPEALRELREILSVDGERIQNDEASRVKFRRMLQSGGDEAKQEAIADFEKTCLSGAATDFGQLILLFTRPNLDKYSYALTGDGRVGVDQAWIIAFQQQTGSQSLHLSEGGGKRLEKLQGEIWVRQGDYLPLRIVLNSARDSGNNRLRDEAKVDYTVISGALLPGSVVYRRFVNDAMALESVYRYSNWRR